ARRVRCAGHTFVVLSRCMLTLLAMLLAPAATDTGLFRITVQGRPAGEEKFEIVAVDGGLETRTDTSIKLGAQALATHGTLRTDANGRPERGTFESSVSGQTVRLTLRRSDGKLELETLAPGRA